MNPKLWLNEYDPDLEAIGRYADPLHDECEGMGVLRECGERVFCSCTEAALLAAKEEELIESQAARTCRWCGAFIDVRGICWDCQAQVAPRFQDITKLPLAA